MLTGALACIALAACQGASPGDKHGDPLSSLCSLEDAAMQGFSAYAGSHARLRRVGQVVNSLAKFEIYAYKFNNPQSGHGNHRLVVFTTNCRYLGSYVLDQEDYSVEGNRVIFPDSGVPGNMVEFTNATPPDRIWIDGTTPSLEP